MISLLVPHSVHDDVSVDMDALDAPIVCVVTVVTSHKLQTTAAT